MGSVVRNVEAAALANARNREVLARAAAVHHNVGALSANESFARDLFADIVDNLPVGPITPFGDGWESASEHCMGMIRGELEKILPPEEVQAVATATFAAYVTEEGDPSRLCALCFSDE
eukprot:2248916-Alexandrium_andersonii.AAC.1